MTKEAAVAGSAGLRERNKAEKRVRILRAAADLFAARGYAAVTTQEIAEAAEVGTGTLFRYVGSKAELLVMVMNERLATGSADGLAVARAGGSPVDAILTTLAPLAQASLEHPENTVAYQREALFGTGPYAAEATAQIAGMEQVVAEVLAMYARRQGRPAPDPLAAHAIYATLVTGLIRASTGHTDPARLPEELRAEVAYLVDRLTGTH